MRDHELRQRAVSEMHLRRWPQVRVPSHIVQWVLMVGPEERDAERAMIEEKAGTGSDPGSPAHREGDLGKQVRFSWERHSEGSSLTLFVDHSAGEDMLDPRAHPGLASALDWAREVPGAIVRSTRLWIVASDEAAEELVGHLPIVAEELVSCRVGEHVRMWSDFRLKGDGFGHTVVAANGATASDLTRQVQRLQELGNYRNRALLGLPVAQECWPKLDKAESKLRALADRVATTDERDDVLLDSLSDLSLELAAVSTEISFRMDATKAYAQLVRDRLEQLRDQAVPGFASLTDFTQRRFLPAMNTCSATTDRVKELSLRVAQLSSLLRARIETRIENQNSSMLQSMERSSAMQLRLQQLVEGLSVVALSYYLIGLFAYLLKGLPDGWFGIDDELLVAYAVVPVVLVIWAITRILKKRLLG